MEEKNFVLVFRDYKLFGKSKSDFYIATIAEHCDDFSCTSDVENAVKMDWYAARALAYSLNRFVSDGLVFAELL